MFPRIASYTFLLVQLICLASSLREMELISPYKIQSMANGRYLTASQQGILGLKTGAVTTRPFYNGKEQHWAMIWDPTMDDNHDGYRLESKMDYLNQVTSFYPDGSTQAMPNIWEVIELHNRMRMFRNKRTGKCLQVLKSKSSVVERTCSIQNRFQKWSMQLLDVDKEIGGTRRILLKQFVPIRAPVEEEQFELDNSHDESDEE